MTSELDLTPNNAVDLLVNFNWAYKIHSSEYVPEFLIVSASFWPVALIQESNNIEKICIYKNGNIVTDSEDFFHQKMHVEKLNIIPLTQFAESHSSQAGDHAFYCWSATTELCRSYAADHAGMANGLRLKSTSDYTYRIVSSSGDEKIFKIPRLCDNPF